MRVEASAAIYQRRAVLLAAALSGGGFLTPPTSFAEYGAGANIAPPALVPSPFIPTGEMGKTCAVVALGREDVCLEPKKLISAYDSMLLDKAKASMANSQAADAAQQPIFDTVSSLLPLIEGNDLKGCSNALATIDGAIVPSSLKKSIASVTAACKKTDDPSPAAQATIKLVKELGGYAQ